MSTSNLLTRERFPQDADVPAFIGPFWRYDIDDDPAAALREARHQLDALLAKRSTAAAELGKRLVSEMGQNAVKHGLGLSAVYFALVEIDSGAEGLAIFAIDHNPVPAIVEPRGSTQVVEGITRGITNIDDIDTADLPEDGWGVDILYESLDAADDGQSQPGGEDHVLRVTREGQFHIENGGNVLWGAFPIPEPDTASTN